MPEMFSPWFVLAGGGTGGHLYPGLAVAAAVQRMRPEFEVTVFGTPRPIDKQLTEPRGYELVVQAVRPWTNRPWRWPGFLAAWRKSVRLATGRFNQRRPAAVLGLGGYAAGPAIVAAHRLGIPTAIFNPDAVPGRANRQLAKYVDRIFVQWRVTAAHFARASRVVVTGCPVREGFGRIARAEGIKRMELDPLRPVLLVTGASQGSRSINRAILTLADFFRERPEWQVLHLTGHADFDECSKQFAAAGLAGRVLAYTEEMPACMAAADIIIGRAGASTLAEITATGRASVLLPYPFDRKRHQDDNARVLVEEGAAVMLDDANDAAVNAGRLKEVLGGLIGDATRRGKMAERAKGLGRLDAAEVMAEALLAAAR